MPTKKLVAILTGGMSEEQDIARTSAQNVMRFLSQKYEVALFDFPSQIDIFLARRKEYAVAIPVFHGRGGEDGCVQGFLETLGVPYLFSRVAAHAIGIDKDLAKRVVSSVGIQTAKWVVLSSVDEKKDYPALPCVVKPLDGGSTQGVSIVRTEEEMKLALVGAFTHAKQVLIEQFIEGDEFTVAVINEGRETTAMPVIQIKAPTGFYDYAAKYGDQPAEKLCPAPISLELSKRLQETAVLVHKTIGARHLTRTDFIVDKAGMIWFLEVNTIPGLSVLFPRAVKASGRDFGELLASWVEEETGGLTSR